MINDVDKRIVRKDEKKRENSDGVTPQKNLNWEEESEIGKCT